MTTMERLKAQISTMETLEALIPAIHALDGGLDMSVADFIQIANNGLAGIGSPYRYESTSKLDGDLNDTNWGGPYEHVDIITVIEVEDEPTGTI